MYPYISIGSTMISMTGLGVVVGLGVFLVVVYVLTRKEGFSFLPFFLSLPILILFVYFGGKYAYLVIEQGVFFPQNLLQWRSFFSPAGFSFHYVGLITGFFLYVYYFLYFKVKRKDYDEWVYIFFTALTIALIPMGIFFVLGDDVVGKTTTSFFGIHALTENSKLAAIGEQVYPVGFFLSFGSFCVLMFIQLLNFLTKRKNGFLGFCILLLVISFILLFQHYPLRGVVKLFTLRFDVKQYVSWFFALIFFLLHMRRNRKVQRVS